MAINIFSGNSGGRKVNSASASSRAQAAKAALGGGNVVASDSGNTAVKATGALGKIGNTVGNVASLASKFLPGVAGTVASGLANLLNDPEWWQSIPGEQITLNTPLTTASLGRHTSSGGTPKYALRPAFAEFISNEIDQISTSPNVSIPKIFDPTATMVTQYLMPQIRRVVNAIPLQEAADYRIVLQSHVAMYALWRHLKKLDVLLKNGKTYLPNFNVPTFPIMQVGNAAWLQSTINRIEEYLRANVRLPHTLCCYLAWRFGRIYKSVDSEKASLIWYSPIGVNRPIADYETFITNCMRIVTSQESYQKANTDLYNTYYDHDLMVEIKDDTQFRYDPKEFALRTNLDLTYRAMNWGTVPIYLDSKLDNATAFMASTVSTYVLDDAGSDYTLFPVSSIAFGCYQSFASSITITSSSTTFNLDQGWNYRSITAGAGLINNGVAQTGALMELTLLKACDIYNKDITILARDESANRSIYFDVTSPAFDLAVTTPTIVGNEHVFAFANLVHLARKHSTTLAQADREAATAVANMVEKIDVATSAPSVVK